MYVKHSYKLSIKSICIKNVYYVLYKKKIRPANSHGDLNLTVHWHRQQMTPSTVNILSANIGIVYGESEEVGLESWKS